MRKNLFHVSKVELFIWFTTCRVVRLRQGDLALLQALKSRGNVWQAKVPIFEALKLSRGIVHNVGVCAVAGL